MVSNLGGMRVIMGMWSRTLIFNVSAERTKPKCFDVFVDITKVAFLAVLFHPSAYDELVVFLLRFNIHSNQ